MKSWFKKLIQSIRDFFSKPKKSYYYSLENPNEEPVKVPYEELPIEEPDLFEEELPVDEPPPAAVKRKKKPAKKSPKKKKNQWEV